MERLKRGWSVLSETLRAFQADEAEQLGAALAYYAIFSLFPLLLLLLASFGIVLGSREQVEQAILASVEQNFAPQLAELLQGQLEAVRQQAGTATGVGLIILLFGASSVFGQLDRSFARIWGRRIPPERRGVLATALDVLRTRLIAFGMVLAVGLLVILSFALSAVAAMLAGPLDGLPVVGGWAGFAVGLAVAYLIAALTFALLFRYLPDVRVAWGDVLPAALLSAAIWEGAKRLLAVYVEYTALSSPYGAVATLLALLLWIYFSSQILYFGAELTKVIARRRAAGPAVEGATR